MSLDPAEIKEILQALQTSSWHEAQIAVGDVTISVSRNGPGLLTASAASAPAAEATAHAAQPAAVVAAAPAPAAPAVTPTSQSAVPCAEPVHEGHVVTSPTVGVVWRSPSPGEPPFVDVGTPVQIGDTLCIVEVMKLMNNVTSDVAGIVTDVLVQNSISVEAGTPLFVIKAE